MNRRELLLGGMALAGAAVMGQAVASEHDHMNMGMASPHDHHSDLNEHLVIAASDCVMKANICLQHCLVSLGKGETEMSACARSSSQVIAICTALLQLASANSKHLPQVAKAAMAICKDCEEECKKPINIQSVRRARKLAPRVSRRVKKSRYDAQHEDGRVKCSHNDSFR